MQIKIEPSISSSHLIRKNDVQKVSETTDSSKNEDRCERLDVVSRKYMYFEVSSSLYDVNLHLNHNWSLLSLKNLVMHLLAPSFLTGLKRIFCTVFSKFFHDVWIQLLSKLPYKVWQHEYESSFQWSEFSNKVLAITRYLVECLPLQSSKRKTKLSSRYRNNSMTSFYTILYEILLQVLYDHCKTKTNGYNFFWEQQQESSYPKILVFRDLSTNNKTCEMFIITNELYGIESSYHRCLTNVRRRDFIYGILIVKLNVMCCGEGHTCFKISDYTENVEHYLLLQLAAHNQVIVYDVKVLRYHQRHQHEMKFQLSKDKSCHEIENGISSLATTSNHKLKTTTKNDNDTCHHESEKFSKCYQQFQRAFRSDSGKSHLNAILFLIILCVPLFTTASGVHNLKYSTNIVKTKYGEYNSFYHPNLVG